MKATFVPPGDRLNPYPLKHGVRLYGGWRLKVGSAILDANAEVAAVIDPNTGQPANSPPPPGFQYALVKVTMTYLRRGSGFLTKKFVNTHLWTVGAGNAGYSGDSNCEPPQPDLASVGEVFEQTSATGYVCYEIASSDARTLLLAPGVVWVSGVGWRDAWFALR